MNVLIAAALILDVVVFYLIAFSLPSIVIDFNDGKPSWMEQRIIDREKAKERAREVERQKRIEEYNRRFK